MLVNEMADKRWLRMAQAYATEFSKDPSTKVGAVIVRPDGTSASWGCNGFPKGIADTPDRLNTREIKYDLTVHAELNAIMFLRERANGYILYATFFPCIRCAVNIIQAGISRVVAVQHEDNERWAEGQRKSAQLFEEAGVAVNYYLLQGDEG